MNAKQTRQRSGGATQPLLAQLRIKKGVTKMRIKLDNFYIVLAILLLACIVGTSFAQPYQNSLELQNAGIVLYTLKDKLVTYNIETMPGKSTSNSPEADIVGSILSGKGFALKDNETHVLRMHVELVKNIDPIYLRNLLGSNKSVEEIKEKLIAKKGNVTLRGSMSLDGNIYPLVNIKFMPSGDNATIVDADVAEHHSKAASDKMAESPPMMEPPHNDKTRIAGHIKVTVISSRGGLIGNGVLIMSSDVYSGKYTVLLTIAEPEHDIAPPMQGDDSFAKAR